MKTEPVKKPSTGKSKAKIETDMPLSEKDEIKKAEESMRQTTKGAKKA